MISAMALSACSEGIPASGIDDPTPVATVSIGSSTRALTIGQTVQLTAVGRDEGGNVVPDRAATWSSDDPLVASVSESGLVTAHSTGSASCSVTSGCV